MRTDEIMREAGLQIAIARLDFSPAEIADLTGVPLPELEKYFRAELANPVEILNARVSFRASAPD